MRRSDRRLRGELGGCHLLMLLLKNFFFPPALQSTAINPAREEKPRLQRCARGMGTVAGLCWGGHWWPRGSWQLRRF